MGYVRASLLVVFALVFAGCAGSYEVVRLPEREADLYPLSQTTSGITIAVDEIKDPGRTERYFGTNLIEDEILPITVVVSNYGEHRLTVKPSDILLYRGKEIIDPLPLEIVVETAKRQHRGLRRRTEEQIDRFFEGMTFRETVLMPNDTYQGVLFFSFPRSETAAHSYLTILNLYREGGLRIRVGVTDLDGGQRLHFGPFSVSLPENMPLY
jgi:hypothetical protein